MTTRPPPPPNTRSTKGEPPPFPPPRNDPMPGIPLWVLIALGIIAISAAERIPVADCRLPAAAPAEAPR